MRALAVAAVTLFALACSDSIPAASAPDLSVAATPDLATPDLATPDLATPDLATPDLATPDLATPDLETPDLATPPDMTPTCSDGVKNGAETDIDCGGPTCGPCALGKACVAGGDCASTTCCADRCVDGASDPANCGACGKVCPGSGLCKAGVCQGCATGIPGEYFPPAPSAPQSVTLVATVPGGPQGIVFDGQGRTFVSSTNSGVIYLVSPSGSIASWASGLAGPTDMTFDGAGNLVVAEREGNRLTRIPVVNGAAGTPQKIADIPGGPWGVTFDGAGNLYTATEFDKRVDRVRASGTVDTGVISGLTGPLEVRFDAAGNLYVGIYNIHTANTVNMYSPSLAPVKAFTTGVGPIGIAFDRDGNLYVASYNAAAVTRYAPSGAATPFITAGLAGPHGIAFDATGALWVVNNSTGDIVKTAATSVGACP